MQNFLASKYTSLACAVFNSYFAAAAFSSSSWGMFAICSIFAVICFRNFAVKAQKILRVYLRRLISGALWSNWCMRVQVPSPVPLKFKQGIRMWEPAGAVALSIFLTCTLFFVVYSLAYFGIILSINLISKIKKRYKELKEEQHEKQPSIIFIAFINRTRMF